MSKTLQTPSINSIIPFDACLEHPIHFLYEDNQAVRNRAVILDNTTGESIYDRVIDGMKLYHVIPANTLENGKQYLIHIQVYDGDGNSSNLSEPSLFYCYSTPAFFLQNFTDGQQYRNADILLSIDYLQKEGESLRSFQFFKYSHVKVLLEQSEVYYSSDVTEHAFHGLENNTTYFFRAIGETNHGIKLDTGYVSIDVVYNIVPANILFKAENHKCDGYIQLDTNIIDIGYETENENYSFHDGMVTLKDNSVTYNSGFEVTDDFILFIEAKKLPLKRFLTTDNNEFSLEIVEICGLYYCHLIIHNSAVSQYTLLPKAKLCTDNGKLFITEDGYCIEIVDTNYGDDDLVVFEVKRKGGIYGLKAYYKSEIDI